MWPPVPQQSSYLSRAASKYGPITGKKISIKIRKERLFKVNLFTESLIPCTQINIPIQALLLLSAEAGEITCNNLHTKKDCLYGKHKPFSMLFHFDLRCYNDSNCTMTSMSDVQLGVLQPFFFYFFKYF